MASRLDAIQVGVPRAVDSAQQQHAAQRLPVVAQEHATAAVRQETREREQRPNELQQRRDTGAARDDLIPPPAERDPQRRPGGRGRPGTRAAQPGAAHDRRSPTPAAAAEPPPDGKGMRVDLRM